MFKARISRMLIVWGIIFLGMACLQVSQDNLSVKIGNGKRIITRQNDPATYWGTNAGLWIAGLALFGLGIYRARRRPGDNTSVESISKRRSWGMRIASIFLALFGVLGLTTLPRSLPTASNPRWPVLLFFSLLGILYLWLAVGIWKRWFVVWRLGFVAIGLTALFFVVQACFDSSAANIKETPAFIAGSSVGALLFGGYWAVIWYRQKKWFSHDEEV